MTKSMALFCALAGLSLGAADASIVVEYSSSTSGGTFGSVPTGSVTITGSDVDINYAGGGAWRVRTTSPTTESIGTVSFSHPTAWVSTLIIGPSSATGIDPDTAYLGGACDDWGGVDRGNDLVYVQARINGSVLGDVDAHVVVRLDIDDSLAADVYHASTSSELGGIYAGSIAASTSIESQGGRIKWIQADGNMEGDVINWDGAIGTVLSLSGQIGTASADVSLIQADTTLDSLLAQDATDGYMFAAVSVGTFVNEVRAAQDWFGELKCLSLADTGASLSPVIRVGGVFDVDVQMFEGLYAGARIIAKTLAGGDTADLFSIGDSGYSSIGLKGSILIDPFNDGGTYWDQPISVYKSVPGSPVSVTIGGSGDEEYDDITTTFGAGIAGIGPLDIHQAQCAPPHASTATYGVYDSDTPVIPALYGLVTWPDIVEEEEEPAVPVTIYSIIGSGTPRDVTSCFTVSRPSDANGRYMLELLPSDKLQNGFRYQVVPVRTGGGALSAEVEGQLGGLTEDFSYEFCVGNGCPSDLNGDGVTDNADYSILLGQFGQSGCFKQADCNNSGSVSGADLSVMLANFNQSCNSECVPTESMRSGSGGEGLEIIGTFGFESFEDYGEWLEGLTPEELESHLSELSAIVLAE